MATAPSPNSSADERLGEGVPTTLQPPEEPLL